MTKVTPPNKANDTQPCSTCHGGKTTPGVCEVCKRLDNDTSQKAVKWCGTCNAYICVADFNNFLRRGLALGHKIVKG